MRLSHQTRYAICALFDLAYNAQGQAVQVRVISERQGIPTRYLEQIFQRLRKAGLVTSKRGPGGGYRLARVPAKITLLDAVEAVEGPLSVGDAESAAETGGEYSPAFLWPRVMDRFGDVLEAETLESICRGAARAAVPRAGAESVTYQI